MLKRIAQKVKKIIGKANPIKYARSLGVQFGNGSVIVGNVNWGSEPYLISIGEHTKLSFDIPFAHMMAPPGALENRKDIRVLSDSAK